MINEYGISRGACRKSGERRERFLSCIMSRPCRREGGRCSSTVGLLEHRRPIFGGAGDIEDPKDRTQFSV